MTDNDGPDKSPMEFRMPMEIQFILNPPTSSRDVSGTTVQGIWNRYGGKSLVELDSEGRIVIERTENPVFWEDGVRPRLGCYG